jgi:hypothetical protein
MAADSGGELTLASWIKGFHALADEGPEMVVQQTAGLIEADMRENIDLGITPDKQAWDPLVETGGKAYENGNKYMSVATVKSSVILIIRGPLVFANWGTKWMKARRVFPERGLPKKLGNAIRLGFIEMSQSFMTRGGRHDAKGKKTNWGSPAARST